MNHPRDRLAVLFLFRRVDPMSRRIDSEAVNQLLHGGGQAQSGRDESRAEPMLAHQCFSIGSLISKTDPLPISLRPVMVPPCISTIHFAIDRPNPAPPCSRDRALSALQNRSKMWGRSAEAIPMPVSETQATACPSRVSN